MQLVDAGLCFVPSTEDLDTTICPYCELEIVGWEKGDDAWYLGLNRKEHEMQAEGCCPFFDLSTDEKPLSKQNQIKMVLGVIESSESEMNKSEMTEQSEFEEDLVVAPVIQKQLTYKSAKRAKNLQLNKVSASETRRETPKPEPKMKGKRTAARKTKDINAEEESRQAVRKKGITKMENQKKNEIGAEIQAASLESTKFTDGHKKSSKNPPLNRAKIDSDEHELVLARKTRQRGVTEPKTVTVNEISDKNVAPPKRPSRSKAIKIGKSVTATESNSSMEATACKEGITITNPGEDKHDRTRSTSRATVIDSSKSNSDGSAKIDDQPMPPISKEIKVKKVVRRAARVDAKEAGAISELGMEKIERKKPDVLNHDVQNINTDDLTDFSIPVKTQCKNNIDTEQVSAIGAKATMDLQSTEVLAADSHGSEVKNTDSSAETLNTSEKYSKLGSQSTWAARDFPRILSEKPSSQIENHSSNATIREVKTTLTLVAPVGQEISGMQPITSTASNVSGNSVQKDNYTSCKFTPSIHAEEPGKPSLI